MKRDAFTLPLAFPGELIIDNFAGGGGTSTGLERAFGRPVDIAINHDPEALAMHAINHPHTQHLCESVWDVDPIKVTGNQPLGLVWLSPDCKHFSKAKGGTPVAKHIRGLAWVGMRWVAKCKPRVMMLENVEEFTTWGPLLVGADGTARPDPARKGQTFDSFVRQLRAHGYAVEWTELRACDHATPTIRKRLFLIARRDGLPIQWPQATHGAPDSKGVLAGKLAPYRTAAECIDFALPANSIFGRKKELATNTQRRVAKGLWRHVLSSASPFIVGVGTASLQNAAPTHQGHEHANHSSSGWGTDGRPNLAHGRIEIVTGSESGRERNGVFTASPSDHAGPAVPQAINLQAGGHPHRADDKELIGSDSATHLRTRRLDGCTDRNWAAGTYREAEQQQLTTPFLTEHANASNQRTMAADEPLRTQCAQVKGGHFSLVAPTLAPYNSFAPSGTAAEPLPPGEPPGAVINRSRAGRDLSEMPGITAPSATYSAASVITPLRGTTEAHLGGHDILAPLSTVAASGTHHALVAAALTPLAHGERRAGEWRTADITQPVGTMHAGGGNFAVTGAHLVTIGYGERPGQDARTQDIRGPLGTAVAGGVKQGVVAATLVDMGHGEGQCGTKRFSHGVRNIVTPLNAITASGGTSALVTACLEQANGGFYDGDGRPADAPVSTITAAGSNQRLITAYAVKYYSSGGQWQGLGEPMHTLPTKGRMGLVQVVQVSAESIAPEHRERARQCAQLLHTHLPEQFPEPADLVLMQHAGAWRALVDITLRMLKPRELFRAQGFPEDYVIHEIPNPALLFQNGKQAAHPLEVPRIPLTATAQVRMCGNSVCPPMAEALVRANFAHEARIYGIAA